MKKSKKTLLNDYFELAICCGVSKMVMDTVYRCMFNPSYEKEIKERKFQFEIIQMLALTLLFFVFFCFVYLAIHK